MGRPHKRTLHVTGFSSEIRARDLAYEFESFGRLIRCDIPAPRVSQKPYAFVEFEDPYDAEDAYYEMHNRRIPGGDILSVEYAKSRRKDHPRRRRGYRDRDSRSVSRSRGSRTPVSRTRSRSISRSRSPIRSPARSRSHSPLRSGSSYRSRSTSPTRRYSKSPTNKIPTPNQIPTSNSITNPEGIANINPNPNTNESIETNTLPNSAISTKNNDQSQLQQPLSEQQITSNENNNPKDDNILKSTATITPTDNGNTNGQKPTIEKENEEAINPSSNQQ